MSDLTEYTDFYEEVPAEPVGTPLVSPEDEANVDPNFKLPSAADEKDDDDEDDDKKGEAATGDDDDEESDDGEARSTYQSPADQVPQDPGEFKPSDQSFQVTVYDEEDKNPRTHTIKSPEDFEDLIEKEPNFGSASALLKANRLAAKMESTWEREKAEHQRSKDKYKTEKQAFDARERNISQNQAELNYLIDKGSLPAVAKKYANADWDDPEIAKQSGVKEQLALFKFMRKENAARVKAGLAPMTSVLDGFNAYEQDRTKQAKDDGKKKQAQARKQAGGRVASASPNPVSTVPKGLMIGRTGLLK